VFELLNVYLMYNICEHVYLLGVWAVKCMYNICENVYLLGVWAVKFSAGKLCLCVHRCVNVYIPQSSLGSRIYFFLICILQNVSRCLLHTLKGSLTVNNIWLTYHNHLGIVLNSNITHLCRKGFLFCYI